MPLADIAAIPICGRLGHAFLRSVVLVVLGLFLAPHGPEQTNFLFTNVLAQIGLGYMFVFFLVNRGLILQTLVILAILGGYGYAFYQRPLPPPDYDYTAVGVKNPEEMYTGVKAHWNQNVNFAGDVDRKFLNFFPRSEPYEFNNGGYQTLNFVPSIATMILGLMAGELLRGSKTAKQKLIWLLAGGAVCLAIGLGVGLTFCPIVKRIWTPTWVMAMRRHALDSGGVLLCDRRQRLPALGLSADCRRHELDRHVFDVAVDERLGRGKRPLAHRLPVQAAATATARGHAAGRGPAHFQRRTARSSSTPACCWCCG